MPVRVWVAGFLPGHPFFVPSAAEERFVRAMEDDK